MKKKNAAVLLQDIDKLSMMIDEKLRVYNDGSSDRVLEQYKMAANIIVGDANLKLMEQMHIDLMNLQNSLFMQQMGMFAAITNNLANIADSLNAIAGGIVHEQRPDVSADELGMNEPD